MELGVGALGDDVEAWPSSLETTSSRRPRFKRSEAKVLLSVCGEVWERLWPFCVRTSSTSAALAAQRGVGHGAGRGRRPRARPARQTFDTSERRSAAAEQVPVRVPAPAAAIGPVEGSVPLDLPAQPDRAAAKLGDRLGEDARPPALAQRSLRDPQELGRLGEADQLACQARPARPLCAQRSGRIASSAWHR
jgi:hypothetical protein